MRLYQASGVMGWLCEIENNANEVSFKSSILQLVLKAVSEANTLQKEL